MCESQEKNFGQKVYVKFFRVETNRLGNRIPEQNFSELHVWCYPEKFYIGFLSQIFFAGHYTCWEVRKKIVGQNISGHTKAKKKPKHEKISISGAAYSAELC